MTSATITVIGAGNMGASLVGGLIKNGYASHKICVTDPDSQKLLNLRQQFGINISDSNQSAIEKADIVILAVKPQILHTVLNDLSIVLQKNKPLLLSIAAGVRIHSIQEWAGGNLPIVRAMPNTPALINCGATALFANAMVSEEQHSLAESILRTVGIVIWVNEEKQMDAVTAVSGSGPAYFFLVIEALQDAAQQLGLSKDIADLLTLQTAYGASRMALESDLDIKKLRANVTSPGGTTESAIQTLEKLQIRDVFLKALQAATQRAQELAEQFVKEK